MKYFELKLDDEFDVLQIRLSTLLKALENCISSEWKWRVLWIEGTSNILNFNVLNFETSIKESECGIEFTFDDLINLDEKFFQIIEILIIADTDVSKLQRYRTDIEMYESCKLSIELVDSSYWLVCSQSPQLIQALSILNK